MKMMEIIKKPPCDPPGVTDIIYEVQEKETPPACVGEHRPPVVNPLDLMIAYIGVMYTCWTST